MNKKRFFNDYILILISSFAAIVVGLIVYKLIQENLGNEALNQVILIQRYSGFIVPLIMMGLGTVVPIEISKANNNERSNIAKSAIIIMTLVSVAVFILFLITNFIFSVSPFSEINQFYQLIGISVALSFWSTVYAIKRGDGTLSGMEKYNIPIVMPFTIFIAYLSKNLDQYYCTVSVVYLVAACLLGASKFKGEFTQFRKDIFLRGFVRLRVDLLFPLIAVLPIYYISTFDKNSAALLSFSISVAGSINLLISPVSTLILPLINSIKESKEKFKNILKNYLLLAPVYIVINIVVINIFGQIYLYKISEQILLASSVGAFFMGFYILLRSVIDGLMGEKEQASIVIKAFTLESIIILISLLIDNKNSVELIMISYVLGNAALAMLSYSRVKKLFLI